MALFAAACGGPSVSPAPSGQTSVLPGVSPAHAYTLVGRQVRTCWFNPADPVLTRHEFRAEAGAGNDQQTNIVIYERTREGKLGLKAYTVSFEPRGDGTVVNTSNLKLPYALGQKMTADVGYWIQGGANCDGPAAGAGSARGSSAPPGPQVSR
jgi:hypothetical protein